MVGGRLIAAPQLAAGGPASDGEDGGQGRIMAQGEDGLERNAG